ncbi:MAG: ATP-binding SpoIIE family protein phosphatase [Candidatus Geothermincolia bacterium]
MKGRESAGRRASALLEVTLLLNSSLDLETRLAGVLEHAMRLFRADRVSVMLLDRRRERLRVTASRGLPPAASEATTAVGRGIAGWVAAHREPLLLQDAVADERFAGSSPDVRSAMAVPLLAERGLLGVLNVASRKAGLYADEDIRYLEAFAAQAAGAVYNSQLYHDLAEKQQVIQKELDMAASIQRSIISDYVPDPRVQLHGMLEPASSVGGDFYSVIPLARNTGLCEGCDGMQSGACGDSEHKWCPRKFGMVIGDVANKGLPAALIMALLTSALYELGKDSASPRAVLERANSIFLRFLFDSKYGFATAFYGFYDGTEKSLSFAKAGHETPILLRRDGAQDYLDAEGLPLGLRENGQYEEKKVILEPGDRLLLYTDGLTGARDASGQVLGQAGLIRLVQGKRDSQLAGLVEELIRDVAAFRDGALPSDDVAVLALELEEGFDLVIEIPSRMEAVRQAVRTVLDAAAGNGLGDRVFELHLCLEELVRNAVEHGNHFDPEKRVSIGARFGPEDVTIRVRDQGRGFSPPAFSGPEEMDVMSERGRGLAIVRHYCEELSFNGAGNQATLVLSRD